MNVASEGVDIGQLKSEVYDHLFSFFRRYYSEANFLARRNSPTERTLVATARPRS